MICKLLIDILKQIARRWFVCIIFGFDLVVLVALSEALRSVYSNWVLLVVWIFVLVPFILVTLWYANPYAIKKLLTTFGLGEESPIVKKPKVEESKTTLRMEHHLLLSKWFYYAVIVVALFIVILFALYEISLGNDMAARFLPTLIGLIVTLVIFTIFFDLREDLEWKKVEDRVKRRIGIQVHGIFIELSNFCEVDRVIVGEHAFTDEAWRDLNRKQLKQMTEKVKLNDMAKEVWKKRDLALSYATLFDSRRARLSEIEGKYIRFLNPTLRASLMDIQDYLEDLRFEFRVGSAKEETFEKALAPIIEKIMKEIVQIRESGIDIGF